MTGDKRDHQIDALLAAIERDGDDELARQSARDRSRRRWLQQQRAESATLAGVLLTRAERGEVVNLTAAGAVFRGRLQLVTTRLCVLNPVAEGPLAVGGSSPVVVLMPTAAITAIECAAADQSVGHGGARAVADDRVPAADTDLGTLLATVAVDRPLLTLHLNDRTELSGTLAAVGYDVLTVRRTGSVVDVPLTAVAACVLR